MEKYRFIALLNKGEFVHISSMSEKEPTFSENLYEVVGEDLTEEEARVVFVDTGYLPSEKFEILLQQEKEL